MLNVDKKYWIKVLIAFKMKTIKRNKSYSYKIYIEIMNKIQMVKQHLCKE